MSSLRFLGDMTHIRHWEYTFLLQVLQSIEKKGTLLDVGCGETNLSDYLALEGWDVTGIDIVNMTLEHAKFIQGDARQIPRADETYDVVISISAIEHMGFEGNPTQATLKDPDGDLKVMSEIRRILKTNGKAIISFPYICANTQVNERNYTAGRLESLLKGFEIEKKAIISGWQLRGWEIRDTPKNGEQNVLILCLKKKGEEIQSKEQY